MAVLFGSLGIADSDLAFTRIDGQNVIWTETQRLFQRYNEDMNAAYQLFVGETTEAFKERYYLPGGGESQEEDEQMAGETASVKPMGEWDVAYPIRQIGDSLSFDDIGIRFVSLARYEATIQTIFNRSNNATFRQILRAIFRNTNTTFTDKINGTLTIVPLANQDGTIYPPVYGTFTEAEQNMYIGTSYNEAAISNSNNPFLLIRNKLEPIFGFPQGGSPILAFCNGTTCAKAMDLAGFVEITGRYESPGDQVTTLLDLPPIPPGSRYVGKDTVSGVLIVEWPRIPSGYIVGLHEEAPKILKRRKDPAATGLAPGLQLWSRTYGEPFETARWRNRQGFGVANRLGGCVVHLSGTSTYTPPAAYA